MVPPAVRQADAALRRHPWFAAYDKANAAERPPDPGGRGAESVGLTRSGLLELVDVA